MRCRKPITWSVAALLGFAVAANAQPARLLPPSPEASTGPVTTVADGPDKTTPPATLAAPPGSVPCPAPACAPACGSGCCTTPSCATGCGCCEKWGPTMPEDVNLFGVNPLNCSGWRIYGWADFGYTYSSSGRGIMNVETRENRFGNEFLVNQVATVLEKPLKGDDFNWGFKALFYAGADAALLRPRGGFTTTDPRFGADFRELYISLHLPVLSEGGVDIKAGRMGTVIGYESAMAPYRPFYSNDYQWFYAEDGAFTGVLANWHVNKQLDFIQGATMGANTFFTTRGESPGWCYLGQVNYWTTEEKKTLLSSSWYIGNQSIFTAPNFAPGNCIYNLELRLQHEWNCHLTQIIQSDMGWETKMPGVGTGAWYSLYSIWVYQMAPKLDLNVRAEWFDDVQGTRTGFANNYYEATLGFDYHPVKAFRFRPEIRYDRADGPVFNRGRDRDQLTVGIEGLFQF